MMPAPSQLTIATSSLTRLLKEEASYHKEQAQQEQRIARLERTVNEDENADFQMKQERRALEETKAVFPEIKQRIVDATSKLEQQLEQQLKQVEDGTSDEEVAKANQILNQARGST